ncbi:hypothetical protein NA643_15455 [Pseudomonas stutzeri]|uniref:hypothetical protein n=1 Tax=Stutzerimonas stutzeri TaxID=316 RepID=UPI000C9B51E5|nr:hypothetical protein [Stutzerimonas stutzeri]MCQ4280490.1 hypothetical protein [Stutzerimonas stutzeri]PNF71529.1 hypothetical protein CXK96_16975 [Stutzerimonas stutzeri]
MTIRSLAKNLPADPDNAGWVLGWGVVRRDTWHFVDIYATEEVAQAEAQSRGPAYSVAYGSHRLGSDDFVSGM